MTIHNGKYDHMPATETDECCEPGISDIKDSKIGRLEMHEQGTNCCYIHGYYLIIVISRCHITSRVVKYVAVTGQRFGSNPLLDMRIHDINVMADPNKRIPAAPEPEVADGTVTPPDSAIQTADVDLSEAAVLILTYWTGPWPLLHFVVDVQVAPDYIPEGHPAKPAEGKMLHLSVAKNLLGITEEQDISVLGDGSFGEPSDEILSQDVHLLADVALVALNFALIGLEIASSVGNIPAMIAFIASTVILTLSFFGILNWFHDTMLEKGSWTHYECFHDWLIMGIVIAVNLLGLDILSLLPSFISPTTPMVDKATEWVEELSPFRTIAQNAKLAFFYMLAMMVCCFLAAIRHLVLSF
jgi:hypothetical protein